MFRAEYARIAGVICRIVRDADVAEELSVEVFWKLSRNVSAQGSAVHGWLYTTAIRVALDDQIEATPALRNRLWPDEVARRPPKVLP